MKKLFALLILTANLAVLNADYYGQGYTSGGGNYSTNYNNNQGGYYSQNRAYTNTQPGQDQAQPSLGQNNQSAPTPTQMSDQQLVTQIQAALQNTFSGKYNQVNVYVNNGYVVLKGTVPSQADKQVIEQSLRGLGIKNIDNQLTIQGNQ